MEKDNPINARKRLLIADDDPVIHFLCSKYFLQEDYEIINTRDGLETLKVAQEEIPDVMLLDICMPSMDGRDICRQLKTNPATSQIKIILFTARDNQYDRLVGIEIGADDYLTKPCSLHFIQRAVTKVLTRRDYS